jgi:hypothetical protein
MNLSKSNSYLNFHFKSLKENNSILLNKDFSTKPNLLGKKIKSISGLIKNLNGKDDKLAFNQSDLSNKNGLYTDLKVFKKLKNPEKKWQSKRNSTKDEKANSKSLMEKAEEFIRQIKTKNNFITQQYNSQSTLNGEKFSSLFKSNSTEDSYTADENFKSLNKKFSKLNEKKKQENLKEILQSELNCQIDSQELTNFSFLNLNVFENFDPNFPLDRIQLLNDFIKEKSHQTKELSLELTNEKKFLTFSCMVDKSLISSINLNRNYKNKSEENKNLLNNLQLKFLGNSKINLNKSYLDNCLFNQEKEEVIQELECVFDYCQMSFKNRKDWETHYLSHCKC